MGSVLAFSSAARAQCSFTPPIPFAIPGIETVGALPASVAASIVTVNTAFLSQTTAFVASPSATQPNQFAGGVWLRGVTGRADLDATATGNVSAAPAYAGSFSCSSSTRSNYSGLQAGLDIGRLDFGGWNVHVGVTGGYLGMKNTTGNATVGFDVPFVGLYAAATNGGFYLDFQVRRDFYDMKLWDGSIGISGQSVSARGWGITSSAGYIFNLGNFIVEPSVGIIYSNVSIDTVNFTTPARFPVFPLPISGSISAADIDTILGRAGVRVATNLMLGDVAVQPFVAASVWHEFGADLSSTFQCPGSCGGSGVGISGTAIGNRVGTFGQYSIGYAASMPNTPWLGYLRFDYRDGERFESVNLSGGIRYQFAP